MSTDTPTPGGEREAFEASCFCFDPARQADGYRSLETHRNWTIWKAALAGQSKSAAPAVYLVATGETHEGQETYTRHEGAPPPLCDSERLSAAPAEPAESIGTAAHKAVAAQMKAKTAPPAAIPEAPTTHEATDDQIRKVYRDACQHADDLQQGFSYGRMQALRAVYVMDRCPIYQLQRPSGEWQDVPKDYYDEHKGFCAHRIVWASPVHGVAR